MERELIDTDYLVIGAGAAGMAFTDALIADSRSTVVLVDRRHAPGGHWNDAYPFVRLHQPSAYYGVNSLPLGGDAIDTIGLNAGGYEAATGPEICGYYDRALQLLLASGRVRFFPLSDYAPGADGSHQITSRVSGQRRVVRVARKLVDATYLQTSVPATHQRGFAVEEGVTCVPINGLARVQAPRGRYVVLGGGKTAMDACLWLLEHGVAPARIRWIKPRDAWVNDRAYGQPLAQLGTALEGIARQVEAAVAATSVADLFQRLETAGQLLRIDPNVTPTMYRCATVNTREIAMLRGIEDVVRLGRVTRISAERLFLQQGDVAARSDDLYVDCTAVAFESSPPRPVFEPERITIQPLRTCQPCLNAAVIGHLEAIRDDLAEKNRLCPPNPYPTRPADWLRMFVTSNTAHYLWSRDPALTAFLDASRLNVSRGMIARRDEPAIRAPLRRVREQMGPALANLTRLHEA